MERTRDVSPKSASCSSSSSQSSDKRSARSAEDSPSALLPLLLEAINETTAEANARSKEIAELLGQLGIDPSNMPKDIQDAWAKADAVMRAEGLANLDEVALTLHMERKKRETMRKNREERKLRARFASLQAGQTEMAEKILHAQTSVETLEKIVDDESSSNEQRVDTIVNAGKLNDYKEVVGKTDAALDELGVNEYLPDVILAKYKTLLELREEEEEVDGELRKYGDLPPNLSEARLMLAQKEMYLRELEHAIAEKMK